MAATGDLCEILEEKKLEWKIKDFLLLPDEEGACYKSPLFEFSGASWQIIINPNGQKCNLTEGWINLYLFRMSRVTPVTVDFSFSLKTRDGKSDFDVKATKMFVGITCSRFAKFIRRSVLIERKSDLLPSSILTLICTLKKSEENDATGNEDSQKVDRNACVNAFSQTNDGAGNLVEEESDIACLEISTQTEEEIDTLGGTTECKKCGKVVLSKKWYEHECLIARTEAIEKLLRDLKRMMLSGNHSDTTIRVKTKEFPLHRCILGVRNPFFDSVFKEENSEEIRGILSIDDCEPEQFYSLMHYIYTGNVDKLSPENVCNLFEVADMYQEQQLKAECLQFMTNTLSVNNFCDFTSLAIKHDDKKLYQKAMELFIYKAREITRNVKWKAFMEKYPAQSNELYMKTLDQYENK